MPTLKVKLPPLYYSFLPKFIHNEFPTEQFATCETCLNCQSEINPLHTTKCCTYHPNLTNYLVGGILSDDTPQYANGKNRIKQKIQEKIGVTPYGIIKPYKYAKQEQFLKNQNRSYTHAEALEMMCPYFDKGNCTIWAYRENLCSTFFCHSVGGKIGQDFWTAFNQYLLLAERELSRYTMMQLGWDINAVKIDAATPENMKIDDEQGQINEKRYKSLWKDWYGKEEEYYIACFRIISNLDSTTFKKIMGHTGELLEESLLKKLTIFKENIIPEYLQLNPSVKTEKIDNNTLNIITEQGNETISRIEFNFFKLFDGKRPTTLVIRETAKMNINITSFIQPYMEKGILIELTTT